MQRFIAELLPPLLIGFWLGGLHPRLPALLAVPLVRFGIPISLVGLLLRSGLGGELLLAAALVLLLNGLAVLLLFATPLRRHLPSMALRLGSLMSNSGYFGIPAAMALLPPEALAFAITYDLVGTLITWSLGPLLIQGLPPAPSHLLASLLGSPAWRGLLLALAIQCTPWSSALAGILWWPSRLVLLLALSLVGMRLGAMRRRSGVPLRLALPFGPLSLALLAKLALLPLLMLVLAALLGLPIPLRDALVLQAATPTAVSLLLLAESARRDVEAAAHLVFWSTLIALVSVPLWSMALRALRLG